MKTALITGASSGIGKEFAKIFAAAGYNLVVVARTKDRLESIADQLRKAHNIEVTVLPYDLSEPHSARDLYGEIGRRNIIITILVNNAGYATYGKFVKGDPEQDKSMLQVNVTSLTELTALFAKEMIRRNEGKILNIASTGAFQPFPKFAVYAASKAYVLHFTEALHYELKGTKVTACVLCPGPTATGFESRAEAGGSYSFKRGVMDAHTVARIGYEGLMKNKMTIIPGFRNKLLAFLANVAPSRNLLVYISNKFS